MLRMKNPRMNNPQPPFPFPIPMLQLWNTSHTKDSMTKFTFFCSKYNALGFPQFLCLVISIYQLEWYLCYSKS